MRPKDKPVEAATEELISRGDALLNSGGYKEAIDVYKQLLKREQRGEWRRRLATAYLERAKELAAKAMYQEAAVLWENIANLCGEVIEPESYIDWLMRAGQHAKAMRAYRQFQTSLTASAATERLEASFAACLLTGNQEVIQALPPDSALRQQQALAQAALHSYCQGGEEASLRERLKGIGFRSPYRDFRQILNALVKLESDPAAALALIERIPAESPYSGLAAVVRTGARRGESQTLLGLDHAQQEMAAPLLGLEQRQLKLLRQWSVVRQKSNDRALFDFIANNLPAFDREQARRVCLAFLPAHPQGLKTYTRLFGPLPPFEVRRVQALQAEHERDSIRAERHWQACVDLLLQQKDNPDDRLAAALILRHMAELIEHSGLDTPQDMASCEYLEKSLELDPDDQATYLKLAEAHKQAGNIKDYHRWVEQGVQRFPADSQLLLAAVDVASERKAFKKAAGFAARLLELDPINNRARAILINSHLSHARKLIKSGKYALAEKELTNASQLEREGTRRGSVEITRGLLAHLLGQQDRMEHELRAGTALAGGNLQARLRLWVEACQLDLEPEDFQRYAQPLGDTSLIGREEVLALVRLVNEYHQEGTEFLATALENLEAPLKKAASQLSTEEDLLAVCESLQRVPHHELLEYFASLALKHWQRPLFVYYQIYGRAEGTLEHVSDKDYQRLENAWQQAQQDQDHRSARLIDKFLSEDLEPLGPFGPSLPNLPPLPPDIKAQLDKIRAEVRDMPPATRDKALQEMLDKIAGKAGGVPPEFAKLIMNLLLLSADIEDDGTEPLDDFLEPPEVFPFPFDLPKKPRSKRKKARRRR